MKGEWIVYSAGHNITDEERARFVREEIGEVLPNSTIICRQIFGTPDRPPKLESRRSLHSGPPIYPQRRPSELPDEPPKPKRVPHYMRAIQSELGQPAEITDEDDI